MNSSPTTTEQAVRQNDSEIPYPVIKAAYRIAQLLNGAIPLEKAIGLLISEFMDMVHAECGSIQLMRPGSQQTQRTLIRKCLHGDCGFDNNLETVVSGWILKHRAVLITDDVASKFNLGTTAEKYSNISSFIATPIIYSGNITGVVTLIRVKPTLSFTNDDANLILTLATEISEFIEQAKIHENLFRDYKKLRQEVSERYSIHGILGNSPAMNEVFSILDRVIPTEGRILLQGESGTGKELIARIIHYEGPRKDHPFIAVDCGALPPTLLESELFGHVRGAFTGADKDRRGLFEEASNGSLFLDEIANTTPETQSKLLRVLQEGEIRPIGTNQSRKVNVRIITASSSDLNLKIARNEFRSDLYFRLNVVTILLPPLRERVEDIPLLAAHFLQRYCGKHGKQLQHITQDTIKILERHSWPGNIRELENVIERAVILAKPAESTLKTEHLPLELVFGQVRQKQDDLPLSGQLDSLIANYERKILLNILNKNHWNQTASAKELNISERTIRYKMKRLALQPPKK